MRRIHVGEIAFGQEEKKAVNDIMDSGRITEGTNTFMFETEFAKAIGSKHCVATNSGTSALIAGLTALKYLHKPKKMKVITTPTTYIATSNAIALTGFEPVYADIRPNDFCIDAGQVEELLKKEDCFAVMPVHLFGYAFDINRISRAAKKAGALFLEDSAQAHGTTYGGRNVGTFSEFSAFSFYIAHNIQAGELGAVLTDNQKLANVIEQVKANGRLCDCPVCTRSKGVCPKLSNELDPRFFHEYIGYNFKTMEFPTAIARVQLKKFAEIKRIRYENVKRITEGLEGVGKGLRLPKVDENVSYMAYPVVLEKGDREALRRKLEAKGIETRPIFGCIPTQQPAYAHLKERYKGKLPVAESVGKNGFYIGCHQYLTEEDLEHIVKSFKEALAGQG